MPKHDQHSEPEGQQQSKSAVEKYNELQAQFVLLIKAGIDPRIAARVILGARAGSTLSKINLERIWFTALRNIARQKRYEPPQAELSETLFFGDSIQSGKPVGIAFDDAPMGIVISGAPGSGKTNAELLLIDQCLKKGIATRFWDLKGEARRFPGYWPEAMVFTPQNAPWQWLEPPAGCDPLTYGIGVISELRTELDIRPETFPLAWGIYERMIRGLKPGDPYPSFEDFRRVVESEARHQKRENLHTLARVLSSIELVLGPNARLRRVPDVLDQLKIAAFEFVGQDPKILRLFIGLHFNKLLHQAHHQEHTTGLRTLEIIDEAAPICSVELTVRGVEGLSSVKRFATMARFTGTALVIGAQNISQLDPFMKNCGTFLTFRTPSVDDALEASKLLGLPRESIQELMSLCVGAAYVRSVGWEQPVKIQTPLFEL